MRNGQDRQVVVFDTPIGSDVAIMAWHILCGHDVYVVEPLYNFYHRFHKSHAFSPPPLPSAVKDWISRGKAKLISVKDLNARSISYDSWEGAVKNTEELWPHYWETNKKFVEYTCDVLKSDQAERVFKKDLGRSLMEYYGISLLLGRIKEYLGGKKFTMYARFDSCLYNYYDSFAVKDGPCLKEFIQFSFSWILRGWTKNVLKCSALYLKILAQWIASCFISNTELETNSKQYRYGFSIVSARQAQSHYRSAGFLIDEETIKSEDAVFFVQISNLTDEQKRKIESNVKHIRYLPRPGRMFSHPRVWRRLLTLALTTEMFKNYEAVLASTLAVFNYFRWEHVLKNVKLKHFITHCDFSANHIIRNIALKQHGVETWYYADSMNFAWNSMSTLEQMGGICPMLAYLYYDHYISWNGYLAQYMAAHPGVSHKSHVVGCLWADYIQAKENTGAILNKVGIKTVVGKKVIAAFDTTYSRNSHSSYQEGIAFAADLLKLADQFEDIYILLKEKKGREEHQVIDPELSGRFLQLYEQMDRHPRIFILSNAFDTSDIISCADLVISFPFTSTTFEALSGERPAVWHDPLAYYKNTLWAQIGTVLTTSYAELKNIVQDMIANKTFKIPYEKLEQYGLIDPFRDGQAISRFRKLLAGLDTNFELQQHFSPMPETTKVIAADRSEH